MNATEIALTPGIEGWIRLAAKPLEYFGISRLDTTSKVRAEGVGIQIWLSGSAA